MRLTTKGRVAVTAMIDVAMRLQLGPISLASISHRQQISLSCLECLFGNLRRHDLVKSTRGPGGGYSLSRTATGITMADIIYSVDGSIIAAPPAEKKRLTQGNMLHELWASLNERMVEYLDSITLQHLVDDQLARGVQVERKSLKEKAVPAPLVTRLAGPYVPNSVFALASSSPKT